VAVWKSEADLESAVNLSGNVTKETLEPHISCWAAAGSPARETAPAPGNGLVRVQVDGGESAGCSGIVLQEEYVPN
jgi:hypothetical protein